MDPRWGSGSSILPSETFQARGSQPVLLRRGSTSLYPCQNVGEGSQINERPGFPIHGTLFKAVLCAFWIHHTASGTGGTVELPSWRTTPQYKSLFASLPPKCNEDHFTSAVNFPSYCNLLHVPMGADYRALIKVGSHTHTHTHTHTLVYEMISPRPFY